MLANSYTASLPHSILSRIDFCSAWRVRSDLRRGGRGLFARFRTEHWSSEGSCQGAICVQSRLQKGPRVKEGVTWRIPPIDLAQMTRILSSTNLHLGGCEQVCSSDQVGQNDRDRSAENRLVRGQAVES